jgi:hypothetical protein
MVALSFLIASALRLVYGRQKRGLDPVEPELRVPACGGAATSSVLVSIGTLCKSRPLRANRGQSSNAPGLTSAARVEMRQLQGGEHA